MTEDAMKSSLENPIGLTSLTPETQNIVELTNENDGLTVTQVEETILEEVVENENFVISVVIDVDAVNKILQEAGMVVYTEHLPPDNKTPLKEQVPSDACKSSIHLKCISKHHSTKYNLNYPSYGDYECDFLYENCDSDNEEVNL